ncbi:hypothetical protein BCV72DRAFT_141188 [Rhizopus microsporus var. microsporus]|uniref:Uncharacterized protein n=2 Tax=Rhizopus microsporus TaxID=58291 RepID=A0A2G4T342_RHIZD|nr:uncharacterized protein RHIMIDRAFT_88829 [Rhizopus microsporus ATCC 52813]ORE05344.1 hypothetical protein BCV72DRAFT_141188 [Rhizopus microsporus var. microsporus]PHZ15440.1 hypothetical protein RHIMIDRAFT_88829 [Rhizopus microsporus ATCC 52813]
MLRPSKLFVSFHQLRHYFQTKISELVHPVNSNNQLIHYKTSFTQQQNVQQFFATIFHRPSSTTATNILPPQHQQQAKLLKAIQQHFPVMKVFSPPPNYAATMYHQRLGLWNQQQLRTMMSATGPSGPTSAGLTWGFPRTAVVGAGRGGPGFTRQFSTTKSPCVTIFQNTTTNQQPNIITHVSSRIFSPAGTKMNAPVTSEEKQPSKVTSVSPKKQTEESEEPNYDRIFAARNAAGMRELVDMENDDDVNHYVFHLDSKKRGSARRDSTSTKRADTQKKLDCIIQHDELSSMRNNVTNKSAKRKALLRHGRTNSEGNSVRKKPDKSEEDKKKTVLLLSNSELESITSTTTTTVTSTIYLLITLDTLQFFNCPTDIESLVDSSFIDSIESLNKSYQIHMYHVLTLLKCLKRHPEKFKVVISQSELRIYFPTPAPRTKQDAIRLLETIGITSDDNYCYSIEQDDQPVKANVLGPDYFKDVQLFIDHIDSLIENGPAFNSKHRRK